MAKKEYKEYKDLTPKANLAGTELVPLQEAAGGAGSTKHWIVGTAAQSAVGDFATAAQGAKADSAVQADGSVAITGNQNWQDNTLIRPELRDYAETKTAPASSAGTLTLDLETGNTFETTLTENIATLNLNNPPASGKAGSFTWIIKQDVTGGRTVSWPASVKWNGGTAPALSAAANAVDVLAFLTTDGGATWYGFEGGLNFS